MFGSPSSASGGALQVEFRIPGLTIKKLLSQCITESLVILSLILSEYSIATNWAFRRLILRRLFVPGRNQTMANRTEMHPRMRKKKTNALLRFSNLMSICSVSDERSPVYSSSDRYTFTFFMICAKDASLVLRYQFATRPSSNDLSMLKRNEKCIQI